MSEPFKNVEVITLYSIDTCNDNPDTIFIFGDNAERNGIGGQACIRHCKNTFGIATKLKPSMGEDSFFSDECESHWNIVNYDIDTLQEMYNRGVKIAFPKGGLGTGLAMMPDKCPKLFAHLRNELKFRFGFDF